MPDDRRVTEGGVSHGELFAQQPRLDTETREIIEFFRTCQDKDGLLQGFLKFTRKYFDSVAIFAVHTRNLRLLAAEGPNMLPPAQRIKKMPIHWTTLVRRCVANQAPYSGAIPTGKDEKRVFLTFLRDLPHHVWLYPAAVGDVVDCLIYAERPLRGRLVCKERLEFIMSKMVLALRRMLIEKLLLKEDSGWF